MNLRFTKIEFFNTNLYIMPRTDLNLIIDFIKYGLTFRRVPEYLSDWNLFFLTMVYVDRTLDSIFEDYENFDENLYLIFKNQEEVIAFDDDSNYKMLKRRMDSILYTLEYKPEFAEYYDVEKRCEAIKRRYSIIRGYWISTDFKHYSIKIVMPILLVLLTILLISLRTYGYVYIMMNKLN